ncbi:MAG: biotin/lipoyl-containing protein [Bacteroidota bacterium]|jgi:glutaconyl-CoA/methylmalonyl-CoA decarboxylase subunit gamma|nr:biotin/lipoyl-containing protein [Bacteroidota bacterium]
MKKFKFTIDGASYSVNVKSVEGNQAEIEVNGKSYAVGLEQEVNTLKTPIIVRKEVQSNPGDSKITATPAPKPGKVGANSLKAPLPGSIIRVAVNVGDTVKQGDLLLVMESMKMENNILAEKGGVVSSIEVEAGQAVMQDDLLLNIE